MTTKQQELREVMRKWLSDNVASPDKDGEWWGYDTNVGDLLSDECLAPLRSLLHSEQIALLKELQEECEGRKSYCRSHHNNIEDGSCDVCLVKLECNHMVTLLTASIDNRLNEMRK